MIDRLEIQNFQGHKDTCLSFHKGINVITGLSYTGKTSIIRALRWLINNKPSGNNFRSRWGGHTGVCIHFNNNYITRFKNEDGNGYVLNDNKFKAIGSDVPDEIKKELNISDINIQYQLDSPFLLSESAGEITRFLNKIIDLEKIDLSLSRAEQDRRKVKNEIEFIKTQIEKLEKQKMEYKFINEMEKDFNELNSYVKIIIEYGNIRKELFALVKKYNDITRKLEDYKRYNIDTRDIFAIERLHKEKESIYKQTVDLKELLFKINKVTISISVNIREIDKYKKEFDELMPDVCPLCGGELNG